MTRYQAIAAAALLASCGWAAGMMVDEPLAGIVAESDLIVTGEVMEVAGPEKLALTPPGLAQPLHSWWQTARITVTETICDRRKALARAADGGPLQITVMAMAQAPRQPGEPQMIIADGPAYPNFSVGGKYVMLLRKFADGPKYYLRAYPKDFRVIDENPGAEEYVKQVKELADLDKWPWGEARDGLRLAVVPGSARVSVSRRPGGPAAYLQLSVAMRNVSDKPVWVNVYAPDKVLTVQYRKKEGKWKSCELYGFLATARYAPFSETCGMTVEPGRIIMVTPQGGRYAYIIRAPIDVADEPVEVRASYRSARDAGNSKGVRLWKGDVGSAGVSAEVPAAGKDLPPVAPKKTPRPMPKQVVPAPHVHKT